MGACLPDWHIGSEEPTELSSGYESAHLKCLNAFERHIDMEIDTPNVWWCKYVDYNNFFSLSSSTSGVHEQRERERESTIGVCMCLCAKKEETTTSPTDFNAGSDEG